MYTPPLVVSGHVSVSDLVSAIEAQLESGDSATAVAVTGRSRRRLGQAYGALRSRGNVLVGMFEYNGSTLLAASPRPGPRPAG